MELHSHACDLLEQAHGVVGTVVGPKPLFGSLWVSGAHDSEGLIVQTSIVVTVDPVHQLVELVTTDLRNLLQNSIFGPVCVVYPIIEAGSTLVAPEGLILPGEDVRESAVEELKQLIPLGSEVLARFVTTESNSIMENVLIEIR